MPAMEIKHQTVETTLQWWMLWMEGYFECKVATIIAKHPVKQLLLIPVDLLVYN